MCTHTTPTCAAKVALGPSSDVVCAARDKNLIRSVPNRPSRMTSVCRPGIGDRWLFGIPEPPRAMELSVVLDFARKSSHVSILPMSSAAIRPVHTSRCQRARPPTRCRFFAQNNRVDKVDHSIFQDCIIINILTLTMIKMRVGASCGLVMSCSASMA